MPALHPLQHPLAPRINEADNEDQDKYNTLQNGKQPQRTQFHGPWEKKYGFNIEDQKHQSKNLILSLELYPTVSDSLDAALISCLFNGIGFLRSQNPCKRDRADRDNEPNNEEQTDVNPLTHRFSMANISITAKFVLQAAKLYHKEQSPDIETMSTC